MEKNKKTRWKTNDRRFICFMDIMGFKDRIARSKHLEVFKMMQSLFDLTNEINDTLQYAKSIFKDKLHFSIFSDSLIIFSKDISEESFEAIIWMTSLTLSRAAQEQIPIKGAIAEGLLCVEKTKHIYFGQALIDAIQLQEEVHYYGVVCHNSLETYIRKYIEKESINVFLKENQTPLKSGVITHYNINWFLGVGKYANGKFDTYGGFKTIIQDFKSQTSGKPRKYIDNTEFVFKQFYPDIDKEEA